MTTTRDGNLKPGRWQHVHQGIFELWRFTILGIIKKKSVILFLPNNFKKTFLLEYINWLPLVKSN